ncbi:MULTISPECIES: Ku protein [unclassified Lysobacter]|uniref:non-homologous end joining protein Ku n=1 Tax=unclassified Lysobacter TaxID=2635362 RepID=UPI001BE946A2|nr:MULTISPECIES: Ku protein [unclassified Lysobacter]MBT2747478.1 Ku protein [Lysobacter sp. ISL-42]MBT2752724.1 Ku protein [Lysobacter sp. ISL-50]MBT2778381.1 Ku protein [Lysobacter sp. ISL-54]MBT2783899.1 Ku protein [Lysobacter sp. ISL-52]
MARPIWTGTLSFGLLNIPVKLMTGERRVDLHFRMLDSRNKSPIRYERINEETGEEVPWKEIVKAFEYDKGSYVVIEEADIAAASPDHKETVDIDTFVDAASIGAEFYEKPYVLEPGKKAEKGYVLLREVLKRSGKVGIGRVVIRTREYLAAVAPQGDALLLLILRYAQEIIDPADYKLPEGGLAKWKISPREIDMAEQLIDSMSGQWKPESYKDDFRARLHKVIEQRVKSKKVVRGKQTEESKLPENAATNVIDFAELLKRSLAKKGGQAAAAKKAARKAPAKAAKKTARKAAKKRARKSA